VTHRRASATIAEADDADRERVRAESVAPGVAQLLALQRSAGNAAVGRLVSARTIQRTKEDDKLVSYSEDVAGVLDAIRAKPAKIKSQKSALKKLIAAGVKKGYDGDHGPLHDMLGKLLEIASGTRSEDELPGLLDAGEQGKFGALAATTMSAQSRTGAFAEAEMQGRLEAEQAEHKGDKGDVSARLNLVVQALEKAYKTHRAEMQTTTQRTIMVFLGGEWHFRHASGPFTLKERALAIEKCRALSALYPDVVLMPGTILAHEEAGEEGFLGITNTAPILWNGTILKLVHKAGNAGDARKDKDTFKGAPDNESAFFDLGELRFAIDICVDHFDQRAKKEGKEADVHLVTGWGQIAEAHKSPVGQYGYMIGSDASGSGSNFMQAGAKADIGSQSLELGAAQKTQKGFKHSRMLEYMAPQPIGSAVPDTELEKGRNSSFVFVDDTTVNVSDPTGNLKKVKV
jgi:hypothetical protein